MQLFAVVHFRKEIMLAVHSILWR